MPGSTIEICARFQTNPYPQLQRHSRRVVRPLRKIRSHSVCIHPDALFIRVNNTYISCRDALLREFYTDGLCSQVRQGIANNTKGTAFVVYEDVTDAKQACDKLNGFNFQNRYLVGMSSLSFPADSVTSHHLGQDATLYLDLY